MSSKPTVRLPHHHAPPEDLLAYASGTADPWLETLVACHLTLCPACREEVETLDALGGLLLSDEQSDVPFALPPAPLSSARPPGASAGAIREDGRRLELPESLLPVLPRPVHAHIRDDKPRFRFQIPGVRGMPLTLEGGGRPVQLVRFAPGYVVPEHGHAGLEWLLILSGHLRDEATGETFYRGDVSVRDTEHVHTQAIGSEEPCVALFATLGPPLPRTLLGRVLARAIGL